MPRQQWWLAAVVFAAFLAAFAHQSFGYGATDWEKVFVPASQRYLAGESIFSADFVYPPFAVLLGVPCTAIGPNGVKLWVWMTSAAGATAIVCCSWWFAGGILQVKPSAKELAIAAIGLMSFLGYVFEVLVNRQVDLIIGGLLIAGLWLHRKRWWLGAALVGLAAAFKGPPLLFLIYFSVLGRWRSMLLMLAMAVGANLLPDLLKPDPNGTLRFASWIESYVLPLASSSKKPGEWAAAPWANHSLSGWMLRITSFEPGDATLGTSEQPRDGAPDSRSLKLMLTAIASPLIVAWLLTVRRWKDENLAAPAGAGFCLMLLLSPMSSKPHFCLLALPAWVVARAGWNPRTRWLLALAIAAGLCHLSSAKDLVGPAINSLAMWYGAVPVGTLLLFAGCVSISRSGE